MNENKGKDREKEIAFRIDGRKFTSGQDTLSAGELLRMAGLDPAEYDLARIHGGETLRYNDADQIELHNGDKYASVRQTASVA